MRAERFASAFALTVLLALSGCAALAPQSVAPELSADGNTAACARRFAEVEARVDAAGVRDGQAARVPGYPFLRVDRLAIALKPRAPLEAWLAYTAHLDASALEVELANLASVDTALDVSTLRVQLADCRRLLLTAARGADPRSVAQVPDDYSTALRALGLYPITKLAFAAGIRGWHGEVREQFATPVDALPQRGPRQLYTPGVRTAATAPAGWVEPELARALGLPALSADAAWSLLEQHAPEFAVETVSDDDRIGVLQWQRRGDADRLTVNTQQPVLSTRLAYTQLGTALHVQLVYAAWFPARPASGAIDPLAGALDGLVWRVTLDAQTAAPLAYDTIHPCGCYHLFFPTERVRAKPPAPDQGRFDEGLFVPQLAPMLRDGERLRLLLESRTHYVQRLLVTTAAERARILPLVSDDALRRLPLPAGGSRSAFDADGLVPGSERLERFFFWPMGIQSAGQMRQWGRHATAFVGRRHFDDPRLLASYFDKVD